MRTLTEREIEGVLKPFPEATALPLGVYTDPELRPKSSASSGASGFSSVEPTRSGELYGPHRPLRSGQHPRPEPRRPA